MIYQYVAYNDKNELVKGNLQATGEEAVTELLGFAGYHAISIKPSIPFISLEKLAAIFYPVKPSEIILFYRELATLLECGISIVTSLELLRDQASDTTFKNVLSGALSDLRTGNQLSTALVKHPKIFSPVYCRLLAVGEASGNLEKILIEIADYMEKEEATSKNVKNALLYPTFAFVVAIVVVGLLVFFVLPSFGSLYSSLGLELPFATRVLISLVDKIRSYGSYSLLAILFIIGLAIILIKTPRGKYRWDKLMLSLPLIGRIKHLSELGRCCRSMSMLFHAGLPLTEVMSYAVQSSNNSVMAKALFAVQQDMVSGEGLSRPMAKNVIFLPMMVHMIKVGEETGNLDTTLLAVARSYEAEAESKMRSLIALIQPAMTLFIGVIVGLIALSLTSAMYSMYGQSF